MPAICAPFWIFWLAAYLKFFTCTIFMYEPYNFRILVCGWQGLYGEKFSTVKLWKYIIKNPSYVYDNDHVNWSNRVKSLIMQGARVTGGLKVPSLKGNQLLSWFVSLKLLDRYLLTTKITQSAMVGKFNHSGLLMGYVWLTLLAVPSPSHWWNLRNGRKPHALSHLSLWQEVSFHFGP